MDLHDWFDNKGSMVENGTAAGTADDSGIGIVVCYRVGTVVRSSWLGCCCRENFRRLEHMMYWKYGE